MHAVAAARGGGPLPLVVVVPRGGVRLRSTGRSPAARGPRSLRGAVLDNVADITFVLGGLTTAAVLGLVPWLVPGVDRAVGGRLRRRLARRAPPSGGALARSRLGHWAASLNYACLGVVAGRGRVAGRLVGGRCSA